MKKGFTLAEVLITLAIIGVVAALTIPVLVNKYQKNQFYTQFMKIYNTLSTSLDMAVLEQGDPKSWECDIEAGEFFETYLKPYLKVSQTVEIGDYYPSGEKFVDLQGEEFMDVSEDEGAEIAVLPDGAIVFPIMNACPAFGFHTMMIGVDTNGKKGPNILGRDIFVMTYGTNSTNAAKKPGVAIAGGAEDVDACCSTTETCEDDNAGISCPFKLIREGKMDY